MGGLMRIARDNNAALVMLAVVAVSARLRSVLHPHVGTLTVSRTSGGPGWALLTGNPADSPPRCRRSAETWRRSRHRTCQMEAVRRWRSSRHWAGAWLRPGEGLPVTRRWRSDSRTWPGVQRVGAVAPWVSSTTCWAARRPSNRIWIQLFQLPAAAITLQASLDFVPTGTGSVAFRAPEGKAFRGGPGRDPGLLDAGEVRRSSRCATRSAIRGSWCVATPRMSRVLSPTCTRSTRPEGHRFRTHPAVFAGGVPESRGTGAGHGLPVQAGHLLSLRPLRAPRSSNPAATTSSRSRCATPSARTWPSKTLARWFAVWGPGAGVALSGIC